jgi:SPFH domain / Band 7 family
VCSEEEAETFLKIEILDKAAMRGPMWWLKQGTESPFFLANLPSKLVVSFSGRSGSGTNRMLLIQADDLYEHFFSASTSILPSNFPQFIMASLAITRRALRPLVNLRSPTAIAHRAFLSQLGPLSAQNSFMPVNLNPQPNYFQRPSLPANTIIRFVPQQTAWIVERMGKFNRVLPPGLAILIPFLDRIAYVKSLKEIALEIPSQSAITADNVTLELDGVLYTRIVDAYKAR